MAIGWSQAGSIEIGMKNPESNSIGRKAVQMMIMAARNDWATLPMALPRARKVIIPKNVTPTRAAHGPITCISKAITELKGRNGKQRAMSWNDLAQVCSA